MEKERFNIFFELLLDEAIEIYREKLENDNEFEKCNDLEDDVEFSDEHKRKMEKIFAECRRRDFMNKVRTIAPKMAAMFVLAIIMTNIITFSVEAYRIKFLNKNIDNNGKYTEVSFNNNAYSSDFVNLTYIPDGFMIKKEDLSEVSTYLKFGYEEKYFCFSTEAIEGTTQIDTENANVKYIEIDNKNVMLIEKDLENIAYWNDNKYAYSLYGNIDADEIIKIIKNIE